MQFVEAEFEPKKREYKGGPRGPRPRSEEQQQWDEQFERAMNGSGVLAVQVSPDKGDEAVRRVSSAARYFERAVTEGAPKPGTVENTVILTWKIRIPKTRARKTETTETAETSAE